jgi:GNAT superfamily N-acetyltransferase
MGSIERHKAAEVFKANPYKYKGLVEFLNSGKDGLVLATKSSPPSIIIIHRWVRNWVNTTYDIHLFLTRQEDLDILLRQLPKDGNSYIFMYDDELPSKLSSMMPIKPDGSRHYFFSLPNYHTSIASEEVIELLDEHDSLVLASESSEVHKNWGFCREFRTIGFNAYGIIRDGKIVSFCSYGPNIAVTERIPIREAYIYTEEAYRNQGFATTLISVVAKKLASQGESLFYSVVSTNTASIRTARAVGLTYGGTQYAYYTY